MGVRTFLTVRCFKPFLSDVENLLMKCLLHLSHNFITLFTNSPQMNTILSHFSPALVFYPCLLKIRYTNSAQQNPHI
jgi:hypothetical protein